MLFNSLIFFAFLPMSFGDGRECDEFGVGLGKEKMV